MSNAKAVSWFQFSLTFLKNVHMDLPPELVAFLGVTNYTTLSWLTFSSLSIYPLSLSLSFLSCSEL